MACTATTLFLLHLIASVLSIQINLYSNQIVSINGWEKTGNHLLGVSAYSGLGYAKDADDRDHLVDNLGVNTIGYGQVLSQLLPTDSSEAWSCCRWKNGLSNYISSGQACETYSETYTANLWSDSAYKAKGIESMIYLKDNCASGNEPTLSHCMSVNPSGGTPINNDGWWTQMMVAFVTCALEKDPDLKYFHIWNEPNAQFKEDDKDGDYYVDFYFTVASAIKAKFPDIELAGPVTWCPPIHWETWEEWFTPLIDRMVEEGRTDLLNYIDFHAYTTWDSSNNEVGNNYARWDHVLNAINSVTGYYYGKTNGGWIRSLITETNVHVSDYNDANKYWYERVIENAKQIMALSFSRDKIELRHHFDLGASSNNLDFWGHTDEYMQQVLKAINDGYPIQFQFDAVTEGFPRFDNGNCIMSQSVWNKSAKTITVLLINYCNADKWIKIVDKNSKISWDKTASFTRRWGPNTQTVSVSGTSVSTTLKSRSVYAITGTYTSNPGWYTKEIEFLPLDESVLMQILGRDDNPSITVPCKVSGLDSSWTTRYAIIKFGFFKALMYDFKWKIQVKIGSTVYYTKENFIPTMEYNELKITSWTFYNQISNGKTINIIFTGTRISSDYKWNGTPGRFVFASLIAGNGNVQLSSSFEEDEASSSESVASLSVAGIILTILGILIGICIIIFVTCYCIKRKKMKAQVTFKGTEQDTPEPMTDDKDATTGGYDMSPIDKDNEKTEAVTKGGDDDNEDEEEDQELEIDMVLDETQGKETGDQYQ